MKVAPMAVRLTRHILSVADWSNPLQDPIRRQDHPALTLDSLHETQNSAMEGLVHRYPDKVLFLGRSALLILLNSNLLLTQTKQLQCAPCTAAFARGRKR
jgi:lysine 2,3-aminomutase